ncbi:MAG: hypothetical protein RA161_00085 [Arsenophonus sp.]|nr:MAG: hypothetical protein RA161_00085 [Arsenophonus sp.]
MFEIYKFEKIIKNIKHIIFREIYKISKNTEINIKNLLEKQLNKLNFVTKKELNTHTQKIKKMKKKIFFMEKKIKKLENYLIKKK